MVCSVLKVAYRAGWICIKIWLNLLQGVYKIFMCFLLQGVCTEAGMYALRERRVHVTQEDFEMAVAKVMQKDSEKNMSIKKLWKWSGGIGIFNNFIFGNPWKTFFVLFEV